MSAKKLAYTVTVADHDGAPHTYGPDDTVPRWAADAITNPAAWSPDGDPDADGDADGDGDPYDGWAKARLQAEVDNRNTDRDEDDHIRVGGTGKVADLKDALVADDLAHVDPDGDPDADD